MIHVTATPLPAVQARQILQWLEDPAAEMFRNAILANIAVLQAEAGQNLIESKVNGTRQEQDANEKADEAVKFAGALFVHDQFKAGNDLITVTLSLIPPVKIEETP